MAARPSPEGRVIRSRTSIRAVYRSSRNDAKATPENVESGADVIPAFTG